MMHLCVGIRRDCYNLYDSYGEICVRCNCCGRLDDSAKWQARLKLNERLLQEQYDFHEWDDEFGGRALQEKNVAENIISLQAEIEKCKAILERRYKS